MMIEPTRYRLVSAATGREYNEDGSVVDADEELPSLLYTEYCQRQLTDRGYEYGIFRYADWLPVSRTVEGSHSPITYRSESLGSHLGLDNLWITYSGYWPERGALMRTCSFKETEAYSVVSRLRQDDDRVLVVASAGNTARAFARVCSDNDVKLVICVPYDNMPSLWYDKAIKSCIKVVATPKGSDYADAIALAEKICRIEGFMPEGGAKNVARRDGMATTVLSATTTIGRLPDVYFQAVGSGTGAIAAWEASKRLIADGRYGNKMMRIVVAQNAPFCPIYDSWASESRELLIGSEAEARQQISQIIAPVLANRNPPYSLVGGLFDALVATGGSVVKVENDDARKAIELFWRLEGIEICPAASVALAALVRAVNDGDVNKDDVVMLNVTGGGEARFRGENRVSFLKADVVVDPSVSVIELRDVVTNLFAGI